MKIIKTRRFLYMIVAGKGIFYFRSNKARRASGSEI